MAMLRCGLPEWRSANASAAPCRRILRFLARNETLRSAQRQPQVLASLAIVRGPVSLYLPLHPLQPPWGPLSRTSSLTFRLRSAPSLHHPATAARLPLAVHTGASCVHASSSCRGSRGDRHAELPIEMGLRRHGEDSEHARHRG
ncbi:hypothetical protein FGB62_57g28 [Gracilaria domingensis]|nr:hypothetical protein FGB62_57g28 [Gracilaria domingensis]